MRLERDCRILYNTSSRLIIITSISSSSQLRASRVRPRRHSHGHASHPILGRRGGGVRVKDTCGMRASKRARGDYPMWEYFIYAELRSVSGNGMASPFALVCGALSFYLRRSLQV